MPDKNWKILPYGKSYGQFVKNAAQQGINLNPTVGDIAAKFWGGSPTDYNFGIGLPVRDQDISTDERLASISLPYTESGYLQTQNLPTENSTIPNYGDTIKDLTQKLTSTPTENPTNPAPTPRTPTQEKPQTPVEPPTTNQVVENATLSATNPDIYALARLASGDINDKNQWYVNEIAAAKNLWDAGKSDADRKAAADYATHIRNLAQMRGVDLGAFGDGNNLSANQANLAWGNYVLDEAEKYQNKFQAVQDNLKNNYGENSNDHFWRLYDEYRQQGYGDRQAAILAGRETRTYQQERVGNLRDAINEYGIDNGNSLNQFGVNTLAQIAEEDNIMGTAIAQGFATPKGNYEKQQAMALQAMKDAAADNRKQAEILAQKILTEYVQGQTNLRNTQTNQTKLDVAEINQGGAAERQEKLFEQQKFLAEYNAKVQENLKILENDGDVTKTGDYKAAKDSYDRAYTRYNDLLKLLNKDTSMLNENELKKLQSDLAEAEEQMLQAGENIEAIVEKHNISQQPTVELPELPENYEEAREIIRQLKATKQYYDDQLREYIRRSRKFGGMDIDRLINDQPNTMH